MAKNAEITLTADTRPLDRGLKAATKKLRAFGNALGKGLTLGGLKAGKGVMNMLGGKGTMGKMMGGLKTAVGLGGIGGAAMLVGNEAAKTFRFEQALTRLGIASMGSIKNLDTLRSKIFDLSNATGVGREDILRGATAYVTLTGDASTATKSMELFAKISKGTGADIEDVARSAAALKQNLKIDPHQFEQAFSILIRGGKLGAIELRDMAQYMASLAPRFENFAGGGGVEGLSKLGAAFQLTRQGFGDAGEAATGMESLMGAITQHAGKIEKQLGVKVYNRLKGNKLQLKGFQEIVEAIGKSKAFERGDWTKIQHTLGRKEAIQTLRMLLKVPGAWDEIAKGAMNAKDVSEDFEEYQRSQAGRIEESLNRVKNALAETFTPDRIETFAKALEMVVKFAAGLATALETIDKWHKGESRMPGGQTQEDFFKGKTDEELRSMRDSYGPYAQAAQDELIRRSSAEYAGRDNAKQLAKHGGAPATGPIVPFDVEREALGDELSTPEGTGVTTETQYGPPTVPGRWSPGEGGSWRYVPDPLPPEVNITIGPQGWFSSLFQVQLDNAPVQRTRRRRR